MPPLEQSRGPAACHKFTEYLRSHEGNLSPPVAGVCGSTFSIRKAGSRTCRRFKGSSQIDTKHCLQSLLQNQVPPLFISKPSQPKPAWTTWGLSHPGIYHGPSLRKPSFKYNYVYLCIYSIPPFKRWGSVAELTCHSQGSIPYETRFSHKTYRPSPTKNVT
jgi:hypothetical protein